MAFCRTLGAFAGGAVSAGLYNLHLRRETTALCSAAPARRFEGKTVIITGGGGTFGTIGALHFVREGAKVVLVDVNQGALDRAAAHLARERLGDAGHNGGKAAEQDMQVMTAVCDIRDAAAAEAMVAGAVKAFGRVDCLWNNAGYQGQMKPLLEYSNEDFKMVQDVNVSGTFNVLKAVAAQMAKQGSGGGGGYSIVQTGSVAGLRGTPTMGAYVASKAAVHGLTMTAAKDLAPHGIRVNTVMPALIGPDDGFMWKRQNELHAASGSPYFARDSAAVARAKVAGVPLKRLGDVEEVVGAVAFLLSDDASYVTGTSLVVAGGMA